MLGPESVEAGKHTPRLMMRPPKPEVAGNSLPIWSFRPGHLSSGPREILGDPKLGQREESGAERHCIGFDVSMQRIRER